MGEALITWLVIFSVAGGIYWWRKKKRKKKPDYSFGLKEAQDVAALLESGKFTEAEDLILKLNSDNLTQVADHITLSADIQLLLNWNSQSFRKDIPNLFLGICYNHQAWIARSHAYANDVSLESENSFYDFQEKSLGHLLEVNLDSAVGNETKSRLIRVWMGNGEMEKASTNFHEVISRDRNMLWPYLHYAEMIQPKWGGNLELIEDLLNNLPDNLLIKSVIELKLIWDGFVAEENYFGGSMKELEKRAAETIVRIDKAASSQPIQSIHRYILYNYILVIANEIKYKYLLNKYLKLVKENYTLYPHGVANYASDFYF